MTPKIAVINDLSGFGRCSLTAAISVLAAMGVQPCPLPTAILTAQTGYPSYYCDNYTDKMDIFRREWEKMKVRFNGIYTGFVSDEQQIDKIFTFLDSFYQKDCFLLADPVMGDDGTTYNMYTDSLLVRMKKLVKKADYTTPNLTELCLLTDTDYHSLPTAKDAAGLFDEIDKMGKYLCSNGTGAVIVTGIRFPDPEDGTPHIGNLYVSESACQLFSFPALNGSYSGTGDLFASVMAGGIARGDSLADSAQLAGVFLENALKDSATENIPAVEGVNYEKYLSLLVPERNDYEK